MNRREIIKKMHEASISVTNADLIADEMLHSFVNIEIICADESCRETAAFFIMWTETLSKKVQKIKDRMLQINEENKNE